MTTAQQSVTNEELEQIIQTIEMFEVILQSNPQDCQSMEILKEAYWKLNRQKEALTVTRKLADTYYALGQFSSALLEYEGILQKQPGDAEVLAMLGRSGGKAAPRRTASRRNRPPRRILTASTSISAPSFPKTRRSSPPTPPSSRRATG